MSTDIVPLRQMTVTQMRLAKGDFSDHMRAGNPVALTSRGRQVAVALPYLQWKDLASRVPVDTGDTEQITASQIFQRLTDVIAKARSSGIHTIVTMHARDYTRLKGDREVTTHRTGELWVLCPVDWWRQAVVTRVH